ncbi:hypothetical protein EGH21_06070 [Halomicroarcula sp. F13]|uniref:Uncharacterized protein n=1 Tax=Haloarcula rubra TaxID=2487747 RepID=A0AAW4PPD5_9EURY|nr:hypothetical protein [Halomicroarcula rubra]MBX0322591.1 hypothetical protein [Halomicroarcula rubra]
MTIHNSGIEELPLTVRDSSLREEAEYDDGTVKTVDDTLSAFQSYLRRQKSREMRLEDGSWSTSNRFVDRYAKRHYGKVAGADRQLQHQFEDLHCVMISLSSPLHNDRGEYRPPADYLDDLLSPMQSVTDAIGYKLGESLSLDYARHWILCPNQDGSVTLKHSLWVDGDVESADFESTVDKHLKHCPQLSREDRQFVDVQIWEPEDGTNTDLLEMQTEDLVGWNGTLDAQRYIRRFGAVLWARKRRQFNGGDTFQEFVRRSVQ